MKIQVDKLISDVITAFLKGEIDEFTLKVDRAFSQDQFNSFTNGHTFDDKYTYNDGKIIVDRYESIIDDTFEKKLEIEYIKQENKIFVFMVKGYIDLW